MNIQSFLQTAFEKKAQEILLNPSQPVRMRVGKDLVTMAPQQVSASETRQMVHQILNEEEKKALFEDLSIQGMRTIGPLSFRFNFQIDFEGVSGSLELQNANNVDWGLPGLVAESWSRGQGLNLVIGPRRSGKTSSIQGMLKAMKGRKKVIAIYSESENVDFSSEGNVVSQFSIEQFEKNGVLRSADVVIIDANESRFCEQALRLAEEGRSVVLTLSYWNLQMGFSRFLDLCEGNERSQARRLATVLQSAVGLRLVPGTDAPLVGAFELMMGTPETQRALLQKDFATVDKLMQTTGEKTGMRTMNQALFQLLMKRKIDMRSAFESSPEPQELDQLLKKVGI